MEALREYLNTLTPEEQSSFASACGTSIGYLRKAISIKQPLAEKTVIAIERESGRRVTCEQLRGDVDWAFIRGTKALKPRAARVAS